MKTLAFTLSILFVLTITSNTAKADHIVFTGNAQGSFEGGPFGSSASLLGLTFTGNPSFVFQTDEFGRLFFNGPPSILGNFVITDAAALFSSCSTDVPCFHRFDLLLTFDSSVNPNPILIQANVAINSSTGAIGLDFSAFQGSIIPFSFSTGQFSGTGGLSVAANNIRGFPEDGIVYGVVFFQTLSPPHPTPEPTTILLFGSALGGLGILRRYLR